MMDIINSEDFTVPFRYWEGRCGCVLRRTLQQTKDADPELENSLSLDSCVCVCVILYSGMCA